MAVQSLISILLVISTAHGAQLQRNLRASNALRASTNVFATVSCTLDDDCLAYGEDICAVSQTAARCDAATKTCQCHCADGYRGATCVDFNVSATFNNCSSTPDETRAGPALMHNGVYVCNCKWGYAGEMCEIHGCSASDCNNHGNCPHNAIECQCNAGWTGIECGRKLCALDTKQQECSGPSRGACNNGTCACFDGWTGSDCQLHGCGPTKDCSKHGSCNAETHECTCSSGWEGVFCSSQKCPAGQTGAGIEQCSSRGPCNNGTCLCDCLSADDCWLGDACEIRACPGRTSEGIDCSGHGSCDPDATTSKFSCKCELGFYGDDCHITCPQDCSGHGKCGNGGECSCDAGWIGLSCDRTCLGRCQHKGECNLQSGVCEYCADKWTGELCEKETCDPVCHPKGTEKCFAAKDSDGVGSCICRPGWVGRTCNEQLCPGCYGKCSDGQCLCGEGVQGFENHHGANCAVVDCVEPTCSGHGVCNVFANASDNGGSIAGTCSCTFGFTGISCQQLACEIGGPVDNRQECTSPEHGKCVDGSCQCADGYAGNACERKSCTMVNGKECNAHGICLADGTCHCAAEHDDAENLLGGWAGDACQISYCGAGAGPAFLGCSGHGKCDAGDASSTGGLPTCECAGGWTLDQCQRKMCPTFNDMECGGNSRGTCDNVAKQQNTTLKEPSQYELTAMCTCKDGFGGDACNTMTCHEFEEAELCSGHGRCDDDEQSATKGTCVDCSDGYAGAFCHLPTAVETDAEEAAVEAANNATYVNLIKKAETKAEAVVKEDDFAIKAARMKLAAQQAEAKRLQNAASALKEQKQGILNKIGSMMNNLNNMNKSARENDPAVAKPTTPSKCVTHSDTNGAAVRPLICAGHGTCADEKCTCSKGWGSGWSSKSGSTPDDPLCEYTSCPDECSHQGRCIRGVCYCEPGFSGLNCADAVCGEVCNGEHEYPLEHNGSGKCECACTFGWEGKGCTKKIAPACPDDCGEHGTCDLDKCTCMSDWSGEFCEIPPCPTELKGVSCTGRGTCLESQLCECDEKFTGKACELLSCVHKNDCSEHGICNNGTCACNAGWGGVDCATEVYPDCPLGCSGVGECKKGKCFCPPGYYGDACQKTYNMCTPENCNGHGTCNITVCLCNPGWKGDSCDVEIKTCPDGCSNQGTCDTVTGMCSCHEGFTGLGCGDKACLDGCGHGTCKNGTCSCDPSWEGPKCSQRTCPDGCSGHGTCMPSLKEEPPFCKCETDYSGSACEISAGGCMVDMGKGRDPEQCAGHGYCETNDFCSCFVGWDPNNECKTQLCDPADCSGHGVCQDSGKCDCHNGWLGEGCDTKACPRGAQGGALCSGHGSCNDATKDCECEAGWCGENCGDVKKVDFPEGCMSFDATNSAMCSGHGACRQLPSPPGAPPQGQCMCDDRWGGADCSVQHCLDDCSGRGKCDQLLTCQCNEGYGGEACKEKTCSKKGCVNGECMDGFCKCNKRWSGEDCSDELCPGNCNGHGTCDGDVSCQCVAGYTGLGCENAPGCVDECGKGQCTPLEGGGGKCLCPLGLDGVACEVEICPGTLTDKGSCFGHGECTVNGDNGDCACDEVHGWLAPTCEKSRCKNGCSGNGICNEDGKCQCDIGFEGEDCSKIGCPLGFMNKPGSTTPCTEQYCSPNTPDDVSCGGKGVCSEAKQKCKCWPKYWGKGCEKSLCEPTCENGDCRKLAGTKRGVCVCNQGFSGAGCSVSYCGKSALCGGHGTCKHDLQECECGNGYRGHGCEEAYCGNDAGCSGHGACNFELETCKCSTGWSGDFCLEPSCGANGDCSGHGICMQDGETFHCDCMEGFEDADCQTRSAPVVAKEQMDGAYTPVGAKAVALKTAKAVAKAAKEQAEKAYEKVVANGGTKEEAELAAKTTQQAVKAAAGEPPAPPPSASISLSVPLVIRGSAGDQDGVLTDIFQGMFKDEATPTDGAKGPMYELASQVHKIAIDVCKESKKASDAACVPHLSIPLQYAVSDMAKEWCVKSSDGKCDVHTVKIERIQSIVQDVQNAQPVMDADISSFDQVKSAILAQKLYDALGVSPAKGNKAVTNAMMTITEHYAERFSESVTVVEHATTLIIELAEVDAPKDVISQESTAGTTASRSRLLSKVEIATHALLQSAGKISPARGLLEQALVMHGVQSLSTFEYKQEFLVHLSKAVLSAAGIVTSKPMDKDVLKSFMCLAKALLSLAKTASTIQKRSSPTMEDIDIGAAGLHTMAVEESGAQDGPAVSEKLVSLCLSDDLQGHDGPLAIAQAGVTTAAAAKHLEKKGVKITPEEMKKVEAAFASNTVNAVAHLEKKNAAKKEGKCPGDW